MTDEKLLESALAAARDTKCLRVGRGVLAETAAVFASLYGSARAVVVADYNTFVAAGRDVYDALKATGQPCTEPYIFHDRDFSAEYRFVERLRDALSESGGIAVAVGSGTISDITKLASHQCGKPYIAVATAASMDGYTAFGASITRRGSKQTFNCPAARAVIADLEVIGAAPDGMNASGYADLIAKIPAGADWIVADAAGIELIDRPVWNTVQQFLRAWSADPEGVRLRRHEATRGLITGLLMAGFAMQAACSSRPASGAEHQFSHLWDMEHHRFNGAAPSHGFKVGIGSLASIGLYEALLDMPIAGLDTRALAASWPDRDKVLREIDALFTVEELAAKAREESLAKHPSAAELREHLVRICGAWPAVTRRIHAQLLPLVEYRDMLAAAGAPVASEQIGIGAARLKESYRKAYHIRRRYTVLDLARRTGTLDAALCAQTVAKT